MNAEHLLFTFLSEENWRAVQLSFLSRISNVDGLKLMMHVHGVKTS